MVELSHVDCGYGSTVILHDLSLTLGPGFHVLIGPNGSGKTTLFRCVAGVLEPMSGTVTTSVGRNIGYAMHRSAFSPKMTVVDNLRYWAILFGNEDETSIRDALAYVALSNRAHQKVRELSRGLVQRLAVARALVSDAEVLLLDEPLSGVDPSGVEKLLGLFEALAQAGKCVVVSTHELAELNEMTGEVIVLRDGQILGQGTPQQLLGQAGQDQPIKWRVTGGDGLGAAIRDLGLTVVNTSPNGGQVEFYVTGDDQAASVNKELAERGITVRSSGAVVDDLTRLYRILEGKKSS